jgi:predicted RND superfamily exporter protein
LFTLVAWLRRHRLVALLAVVLWVGGLALAATQLRLDNSLDVWFVDDDPTLGSYRSFLEEFGNDEVVVTAIHGEGTVFDAGRLDRLFQLTEAVQYMDGVARVQSLANVVARGHVGGRETVTQVAVPPVDSADVAIAREAVAGGGLAGMFVGRDGRTLVMYTWMSADPEIDTERGRVLDAIRDATRKSIAGTSERASHAGLGVVYDGLNRATIAEGGTFILLSYLVMFVVLYLIMRRWIWVVLALLSVICADIGMLGVMALLGRPINMITMALPALVMILGVANIVHMASELEDVIAKGRPDIDGLTHWLTEITKPVALNTLTTALAFLALMTASMSVTRDYGLFAAIGVVLAFIFSIIGMAVVLPRVVHYRPLGGSKAWMTGMVERAMGFAVRRRARVIALFAVATVVGGVCARNVVVDTYSMEFLPGDHPVRAESAAIEHSVGPYVPVELTLKAPEAGGWRRAEFLNAVAAAQAAVEADTVIGRTTTIADVVRETHVRLTGEAVARHWVPETDEEAKRILTTVEALVGTGGMVSSDDRTVRLTATAPMASVRTLVAIAARAERAAQSAAGDRAEVAVSGYVPLYGQMIAHIVDNQVKSFALSLLTVFAVVWIILRSLRLTLAAIPPNLVPIVITAGFMGLVGIRLDIVTVTIAAVVLGIIVDDTVYVLYRLRRELREGKPIEAAVRDVARASGVAVVSTSIIFCVGFAVVALAGASSIANVGLLTAVAIAAALLGDMLLLPALASIILEKRIRRPKGIPS